MASIGSSQRLSAGKSRNSQQDERRDQLPSDAPAFPAGTDKKIRAYVYRGNGRVKAGLCSRQPSGSWWTHSLNWRHAVNFHTGRLLLLSCCGVRASILKRDWPKHHDNTGDSEGKSTAPVQTGTTAATSNTARRLGPYSGHGLRFHPVQSLGGRDSRKERLHTQRSSTGTSIVVLPSKSETGDLHTTRFLPLFQKESHPYTTPRQTDSDSVQKSTCKPPSNIESQGCH